MRFEYLSEVPGLQKKFAKDLKEICEAFAEEFENEEKVELRNIYTNSSALMWAASMCNDMNCMIYSNNSSLRIIIGNASFKDSKIIIVDIILPSIKKDYRFLLEVCFEEKHKDRVQKVVGLL